MPRGKEAKVFIGVRVSPDLATALDTAIEMQGVTRTQLVEGWLRERAVAEGWLEDLQGDVADGN